MRTGRLSQPVQPRPWFRRSCAAHPKNHNYGTLAAVLAVALGLPVLAFIAVVEAVGADQSLLSGGLTFVVVVSAVIAMVCDIKRMADEDKSAP